MNALKLVASNQERPAVTKSKGFVLQHQSIDDQIWSEDPHCMLVAQYLIRKAAYSPHTRQYGKHSVKLNIGQFVTSNLNLAKLSTVYALYKTSKNPEASSKSAITRVLDILTADGFLSKVVLGHGKQQCTILTLKNWGKFQSKDVSFLKTKDETLNETQEKTKEPLTQQGLDVIPKTNQETIQKSLSESNTNKVLQQQNSLTDCEEPSGSTRKSKIETPYKKILELYSEILPHHQQVRKYDTRKPNIKARHVDLKRDLGNWRKYFEYVRDNCQWMTSGQYPAAEKFDYLFNASNFEDIYNGGKDDRI